ncbi:MFS transporter [Dictyobacter alpinus]|uniref:MFS transporter n=1 Tax=Dictyobacter alpinus TaxID=2014873 RepID=A0A402BEK6_9CHLR|nr:MFS transporter [Dictyobacter alpinus]GCE29730.1 MFS transporter [Dictyobacter alpinus]
MSTQGSYHQPPAPEEPGEIYCASKTPGPKHATPECKEAQRLTDERAQFLVLWVVSNANYIGYAAMQVVLPLLAIRLTRLPLLVSGVGFAQLLPALLLGLCAGALGDRYDRRSILLLSTAIRVSTFALVLLTVLFWHISLPLLYVLAAILGMTETVEEPALASVVPMVVPRTKLERANTLLVGAQNVLGLVADPLGGFLVSVGVALSLSGGGICAGIALAALLCLRGPLRNVRSVNRHIGTEMLEGLCYLWHTRLILTISLMAGVINAAWSGDLIVMALYAVKPGPLDLAAPAYGLLLAVISVGSVLGAALTIPVQRWLGRRWAIGLNILGNGLMFATPGLTTNLWLIGASMFFGGLVGPMWTIAVAALQGRSVPAELQGRVTAGYRTFAIGCSALGPVLGGLLSQYFGLQATLSIFGVLTWLMFIPFLRGVTEQAMT